MLGLIQRLVWRSLSILSDKRVKTEEIVHNDANLAQSLQFVLFLTINICPRYFLPSKSQALLVKPYSRRYLYSKVYLSHSEDAVKPAEKIKVIQTVILLVVCQESFIPVQDHRAFLCHLIARIRSRILLFQILFLSRPVKTGEDDV